jgi:hypothetical protein
VLRRGVFVVAVVAVPDSALERRAERFAERAMVLLTDASWRERWLAGEPALQVVPDAKLDVAAAVGAADPVVVCRGFRVALEGSADVAWPLVRRGLVHDEAEIRETAWRLVASRMARLLAAETPEHAGDLAREVERALADESDVVRAVAATCIAYLVPDHGLPLVERALDDLRYEVVETALAALTDYADARVDVGALVSRVVRILAHAGAEHRLAAARVLGSIGGDTTADALRARLAVGEPGDDVRAAIEKALAE